MLILTEHRVDGVSGRGYREFQGERYWLWANRGIYASQVGGKQRLLHLEIYRAIHGEPHIRAKIECVDGDMCNLNPGNWIIKRRVRDRKHMVQEEDGIRFYFKPEGYYKADYERHGGITMHRYVWQKHNGEIQPGMHVHHIDGDKSNNRIENLELLTASDHSIHHGGTNPWVKSEANKRQILEAGKLAKKWHASDAGLKWHSENGVRTWKNRKLHPVKCVQCGQQFDTAYPTRAKYCGRACKSKALYAKSRDVGL